MGKDVGSFLATILKRSPYQFQTFLFGSYVFVLIVNPGKEERVETHLTKQRSRRCMMTKGIDVPGHIRDVVEGVLEPPQSHRHLIDEVLIVHVGLI